MSWHPHLTVACIIEHQNKFLFVEEYAQGKVVLNQPAGHLEPDESLAQATVRETLEESGYQIEIQGLVGYYSHKSPLNNETYYRMCFYGVLLHEEAKTELDPDIIRALWLSAEEFNAREHTLRTPMVKICLDDYLAGKRFPVNFIHEIS